jgi:16S rRNA (cytosine967-C5)-methyltransferase
MEIHPGRFSPDAVITGGGGSILRDPWFADGLFSIQDEASQLVTLLLGVTSGLSLLDLCAAPGGKATHAAELMGDQGQAFSVERSRERARLLKKNVDRVALSSIRIVCADAVKLPITPGTRFHRVLVDPPCSALGVLRRNPEIKWRLAETDIDDMIHTQTEILEEAAGYTAPGGSLVYSVCTINPDEGRRVVEAFLTRRPEFSIDDPNEYLPRDAHRFTGGTCLLTTPDRIDPNDSWGPDGFFAARMTRRQN